MKVIGALVVWSVGFGISLVWLGTFWHDSRRRPAIVLAVPLVGTALGVGGWASYDFQFGHWVGDISVMLAIVSLAVSTTLLFRRSRPAGASV
jgi:hypothetical protein